MKIQSLSLEGFRNIAAMEFHPCGGANVIWGDNAQGKTNLLEAVWMFTGSRSFRGSREGEMIGFGHRTASLHLAFQSAGRDQTASLVYGEGEKRVQLNEIKQERSSKLTGSFCAVVFSPDHLSLVKQGPGKRRRLMDDSLCQALPKYGKALEGYEKALKQRNRLLKDIPHNAQLLDTLEIWDGTLAEYGSYLCHMRERYVTRLAELAAGIYSGISSGKEAFLARYLPGMDGEETGLDRDGYRRQLWQSLQSCRADDLQQGVTGCGPHRDDIDIQVGGLSARSFGSQGQQRSCILALKLAECAILEERFGEPPVVLLDDVMSELDDSRRSYLLNQLSGRQVLLTCCDASAFRSLEGGRVFRIQGGALAEG